MIFDIAEYYKRELQDQLNNISKGQDPSVLLSEVAAVCQYEIEEFNKASRQGQNITIVSKWERLMADQLSKSNIKLPDFTKSYFGMGLSARAGVIMFTEDLAEVFNPAPNFSYNFDFSYKRSKLYLDASLGGSKLKNNYFLNKGANKGNFVSVAQGGVSYGYDLMYTSKFILTPFVGYSFFEVSKKEKNSGESLFGKVDYNLLVGAHMDFVLKKRINYIPDPYFKWKDFSEIYIRARLYISKVDFADDLNGYSINISIDISYLSNFLRTTKRIKSILVKRPNLNDLAIQK